MGVPVERLPDGMLDKLLANDPEAMNEFTKILRAYVKEIDNDKIDGVRVSN